MAFADRTDAGERLAAALERYRGQDAVVVALPRGGVAVGLPVARALDAPLTIALIRKIGVPSQPELAMGAVVDGERPTIVKNEDIIRQAQISAAAFDDVVQRELAEIARRRQIYLGDRPPVPIQGRVLVLVDDGIATGATVRAAIVGLQAHKPRAIVLAVPVAEEASLEKLRGEVDEVVCLEPLDRLGAISLSYAQFPQLSDGEVVSLLDEARELGRPR